MEGFITWEQGGEKNIIAKAHIVRVFSKSERDYATICTVDGAEIETSLHIYSVAIQLDLGIVDWRSNNNRALSDDVQSGSGENDVLFGEEIPNTISWGRTIEHNIKSDKSK